MSVGIPIVFLRLNLLVSECRRVSLLHSASGLLRPFGCFIEVSGVQAVVTPGAPLSELSLEILMVLLCFRSVCEVGFFTQCDVSPGLSFSLLSTCRGVSTMVVFILLTPLSARVTYGKSLIDYNFLINLSLWPHPGCRSQHVPRLGSKSTLIDVY